MSDSNDAPAKARSAARYAYAEFADAGMLMSLVAAMSSGSYSVATGSAPHWAVVAGTAICAAYFSLPGVRALGRGLPAPELTGEVLAAASSCAVRAIQDGDDGMWAVLERGSAKTRFMTNSEFIDFRAALPQGTSVAVIDMGPTTTHVRRYVNGALDSTGEHAAHTIYGQDGTLKRAVDYHRGNYAGERDLDAPAEAPAP